MAGKSSLERRPIVIGENILAVGEQQARHGISFGYKLDNHPAAAVLQGLDEHRKRYVVT